MLSKSATGWLFDEGDVVDVHVVVRSRVEPELQRENARVKSGGHRNAAFLDDEIGEQDLVALPGRAELQSPRVVVVASAADLPGRVRVDVGHCNTHRYRTFGASPEREP